MKKISTTKIIFFLIFFFPYGFYLLYKRNQSKSKKHDVTMNIQSENDVFKVMNYKKITLWIFLILVSITGFFQNQLLSIENLVFLLLLFVGVLICEMEYRRVKLFEKFKVVRPLIQNSFDGDITLLSRKANLSFASMETLLKQLIDENFLMDSYIDYQKGMLVSPLVNTMDVDFTKGAKKMTIVNCSSCGAKNEVFQNMTSCKYCGTILHKEDRLSD